MRPAFSFRDLVDPVASRGGGHPLRTGAIVLALGVLVVVAVFLNAVPILDAQSGYTLRATFAQANNVSNLTPVRVDGVDVGEVTSVGPGPDPRRSSTVSMLISKSGLVIHSDASAEIRWRTILGGNMYIDLNPGSPDAPALHGPIPLSHTADQVELDDVLRLYNGGTVQAQRSMLRGLSATLAAPAGIDRSIGALGDLRTVGAGLAPYQGTLPGDLSGLVASSAHAVRELGASTADLQNLVSGAAATLDAVDVQKVALGRALALSPSTLAATLSTSHRLDTTLRLLTPLAAHLEPGAARLARTADVAQAALAQLTRVLADARPLLAAARPTFAHLASLAGTGTPLISALRAPLARLNTNILPWLSQRSSFTRLRNYESVGPFFSVLDNAAAGYDASGFRLYLSTLLGSASVIDEANLIQSERALSAGCRAAAKPGQAAGCGAVTRLLTGMFLRSGRP
ncbi:MAG TPA: MlaD family protein [Solirubrobacteraceae bacterium]|nr:MlaD family protein [Solirubrobacteraceae bacterium]